MTAPLFDSLGTPYYLQWGFDFDHSDALDLGEYTAPTSLALTTALSGRLRAQESTTAQVHLDSPLTRHAQQAAALAFMRQTRGFAPVATLRYSWTDGDAQGTSRLYLQTGTEFWAEVGE